VPSNIHCTYTKKWLGGFAEYFLLQYGNHMGHMGQYISERDDTFWPIPKVNSRRYYGQYGPRYDRTHGCWRLLKQIIRLFNNQLSMQIGPCIPTCYSIALTHFLHCSKDRRQYLGSHKAHKPDQSPTKPVYILWYLHIIVISFEDKCLFIL
jgi:hypothetical protein